MFKVDKHHTLRRDKLNRMLGKISLIKHIHILKWFDHAVLLTHDN